jgi:hypothetical protein
MMVKLSHYLSAWVIAGTPRARQAVYNVDAWIGLGADHAFGTRGPE